MSARRFQADGYVSLTVSEDSANLPSPCNSHRPSPTNRATCWATSPPTQETDTNNSTRRPTRGSGPYRISRPSRKRSRSEFWVELRRWEEGEKLTTELAQRAKTEEGYRTRRMGVSCFALAIAGELRTSRPLGSALTSLAFLLRLSQALIFSVIFLEFLGYLIVRQLVNVIEYVSACQFELVPRIGSKATS